MVRIPAAAAHRRHHRGVVRLRHSGSGPQRPRQWFSECEVHLECMPGVGRSLGSCRPGSALEVQLDRAAKDLLRGVADGRTAAVRRRRRVRALAWPKHDGARDRTVRLGTPPVVRGVLEPVQSVGVRPDHGVGVRAAVGGRRRRLVSTIPAPRTLACRTGATSRDCGEGATVADTPEEAWLTVSPVARVFGLATTGFTMAFLALVLADLDFVVFGDARIEHLKWACAWAAPMSLVSAIVVSEIRLRAAAAVRSSRSSITNGRCGPASCLRSSSPRCGDAGCE